MYYSEELLQKYSLPLSRTEKDNCESTIHVVMHLLQDFGFKFVRNLEMDKDEDDFNFGYSMNVGGKNFTIMLQGSYGNGTGIRQESDVDIAIISESTWHMKYSNFISTNYGFVDSNFSILEFKKNLATFIKDRYPGMIRLGNKCIDFSGNGTSRKNVDLVPSLRYRDYSNDNKNDPSNFVGGIYIKTEDGKSIINYPEQTRSNNIGKNKATSYYYKKLVRIIKEIKSDMLESGFQLADKISSFEIESILYNVPNYVLSEAHYSMKERVKSVVNFLATNSNSCSNYTEPNELLKIFDNCKNSIYDYQNFIIQMKGFIE